MITTIIFDLDGTLIDSMNIWHECDVQFFSRRGIEFPSNLFDDLTSNNFTDLATYFKQRFCLSETVEEIMDEWFTFVRQAYEQTIPLKPYALEVINQLKDMGFTLALGTSNERSLAECAIKRLGLYDFFSAIVVGCDCVNGKPAPDIFLLIAEKLGVLPEECLVIEDSLAGVQAAKNAGMMVFAVADEHSARDKEQICEVADRFCSDLRGIVQ